MANTVLFQDNFNKPLDPAQWEYPTGDSSFYGRTQQRDSLPEVSNGALHLELDTYNPNNGKHTPSFFGSEAITKQKFGLDNGAGVAFVVKAHFVSPIVGGIVGGMFPFINIGDTGKHDEIDFEALTNDVVHALNQIHTNVYANETLGGGHPITEPISSPLTDTHTYRIVWQPNQVRWLVDGKAVRTDTTHVPQHPMQLHLNIWAPSADWSQAYNAALQPTTNQPDNVKYFFDVNSVKVVRLASAPGAVPPNEVIGTNQSDHLSGTNGNDLIKGKAGGDHLFGLAGDDTILGGRGDDNLHGGKGKDELHGGANNDNLHGGSGTDLLKGGRGDDVLNGGKGDDLLAGGPGHNRFDFTTALGPHNVDTIADFGSGDTIGLAASVFSGIGAKGELADALFATSTFDTGIHLLKPDALIVYNSQSGDLFYDENGNAIGGLVLFATVTPGTHLDHTDFFVM
jgi:Glycosyl hydrolases family 16/RTX calcium-binding nonapeptide repeat (4 copies)